MEREAESVSTSHIIFWLFVTCIYVQMHVAGSTPMCLSDPMEVSTSIIHHLIFQEINFAWNIELILLDCLASKPQDGALPVFITN